MQYLDDFLWEKYIRKLFDLINPIIDHWKSAFNTVQKLFWLSIRIG